MHLTTTACHFLSLTAIAGESSPLLLSHLGISQSYGAKLITGLKKEGYIKTHYKNKLRGYRLTVKGKRLLLSGNPERLPSSYPATAKPTGREANCQEDCGSSRHLWYMPCF